MSDTERFKHDYHKYADQQVHERHKDEALGRLRMAFFISALGPGASIVMHTIAYEPSNLIRYAVQGTALVGVLLLIVNFVRLPGQAKSSPVALSIMVFTLLAAAATYPVARIFSLLPT